MTPESGEKREMPGSSVPGSNEGEPRTELSCGLARRLGAALAVAVAALPAAAQEPAVDGEFNVQRLSPAPGPRNFLTTRGARVDGHMAWSAGLVASYAHEPFVVLSCESPGACEDPGARRLQEVRVVENLVVADVLGSLALFDRLQLGIRIPVTYVEGDGMTEEGQPDFDEPIDAVGLSDVEIEAKTRLYGGPRDPVVLGAALFGTLPLGTATARGTFIGDPTPGAGVRGIVDVRSGPFLVGANVGGIIRGSGRVGEIRLGPELRYGVAAGLQATPILRVLVDGFGATRLSSRPGTDVLEILGALQVTPVGSPIAFTAGAGRGVIEGAGAPNARVLVGLAYLHEPGDRDGDGIPDSRDLCPTVPEDRDGFEDEDGCPELDNDGDGIEDAADRCPNEPEDFDGFQDADGCPDPDNDGDGIPDERDACPDEPETFNDYQDDDGCPDDPDSDGDGIPDSRDECPNEPEDTDGFQDEDGCPDPDNDGDGIPDERDECVDEPETFNGFEDEDGCPDEVPLR